MGLVTPMARFGHASGTLRGESTGGAWTQATSSGTPRRGSPPAQGGMQILGKDEDLLRPLVPGSYLFGVGLPEEYLCGFLSGRRLLDLFPCSALLGPTMDTCFFQSYGGFCTRILRSILVLLSLLPYTAHCLVLSGT